MINLLYESLPNSITVGDKDFLINTDFKYWIELSDALNNQDCDKTYLTNEIQIRTTAEENRYTCFHIQKAELK